jgi:tetratricopeptide (TPR) repeat protein
VVRGQAHNERPTDYEIELERIDRDISELEDSALAIPIDVGEATRYAYLLYHRASLTGNFAEFEVAETAIDDAIRHIGPWADLCLLKANVDFKLHRLVDARHDLEMAPELADVTQARALKADLDLQEGRYEDAREGYEGVIKDDRTWDNLARLAYFKAKMGDVEGAEQLYIEAEDEITAKEMRSYAWVELQRGLLELAHGRYESARTHYEQAGKAYSGYWLVDKHIAELLGALGEFDEAVALYEEVIGRVPRPDLQQALGDLYVSMGEPDQARPWHEKALAAYLESVQRGDVHYLHHLTDFYADVREDGAEAVRWARKDLELRQNFSTQAALAWGLYRDGQLAEALDAMHKALSSGVRDAELFCQAGMIHLAADRTDEGKQFLREAAEINPHYQDVHVHR